MDYRIEHDSMGEVKVPADRLWAAQTQRSHENFKIGVDIETMPREITHAFGILKKAAALANAELKPEKMTSEKLAAISAACDEVISGKLNDHFPLVVWQTGSGTQSNMNANEVIANRANQIAGQKLCHPNDDINMSQSSNDTFPTAMHISAVIAMEDKLIPAVETLIATFKRLEEENEGIVKSGRTHLQDATPIKFSQEISGWRSSLERDVELLKLAVKPLYGLALGGFFARFGYGRLSRFKLYFIRQNACKVFQFRRHCARARSKVVVSKHRRNCDEEPCDCRKKGSCDSGSKLLQCDRRLGAHRTETVHNAPHCSEQP